MQVRRKVWAYLIALSGAGTHILPAQTTGRPVVSVSMATPSVLRVARDSVDVVVQWAARCAAGGVCPSRYRVALSGQGVAPRVFTAGAAVRRATVRIAKPLCPLTEYVRVAVAGEWSGVAGPAAAAGVAVRCRAPNAVERAHVDSFPKANHRITLCSKYGQKLLPAEHAAALTYNLAKATTAQDSGKIRNHWEAIRLGLDSVYTPQPATDSIHMWLGYKYPIAMLEKNRYTGKVRVEHEVVWRTSDPNAVHITPGTSTCQAMIDAWESERDS